MGHVKALTPNFCEGGAEGLSWILACDFSLWENQALVYLQIWCLILLRVN